MVWRIVATPWAPSPAQRQLWAVNTLVLPAATHKVRRLPAAPAPAYIPPTQSRCSLAETRCSEPLNTIHMCSIIISHLQCLQAPLWAALGPPYPTGRDAEQRLGTCCQSCPSCAYLEAAAGTAFPVLQQPRE